MASVAPLQPQVIYFIERQPPQRVERSELLDRIKQVAGITLALLGLVILVGATIALGGYFTGSAVTPETVHSFFLTGIVCAGGGFHLAGGGAASAAEISAGPVTFSI